jgi:hypothetical protein
VQPRPSPVDLASVEVVAELEGGRRHAFEQETFKIDTTPELVIEDEAAVARASDLGGGSRSSETLIHLRSPPSMSPLPGLGRSLF